MDRPIEHHDELNHKVLWDLQEHTLDAKSIMDVIPTSKLNMRYLKEITYKIGIANEKLVDGTMVFDSNGGPGHLPDSYHNRCHQQILLMTPCGKPLSTFSSKFQLLSIFRDLVTAHWHGVMVSKSVLHGDLSPSNLIIYDGKGYFIDFDHAIVIGPNQSSICTRGIGTLPYISDHVLMNMVDINFDGVVVCSASDDLESLFYIFLELIGTYPMPGAPPDQCRRKLPWNISSTPGWVSVAMSKRGFLYLAGDLLTQFYIMPYFSSFAPAVLQWHKLLRDGVDKAEHRVTHEKVKAVLDCALENTQDEHLPLPQSSLGLPTTYHCQWSAVCSSPS